MAIRPVKTEFFSTLKNTQTDERTDKYEEANNRYLQFCERAHKGVTRPA
jgi:hypothetical protein